ncbi:hypothetical protein BST47_14310, partial [Mycolicibacterium tusciae]
MLDLEPQGPLPQQIYWRRRALALGVAAIVIGVIAALSVVIIKSTGGTENTAAEQPAPPAATPLPGENPEVKTPVVPPAQNAPPPTPT